MHSRPLVSIVIPCHNDGIYLADAVTSAFSQDYSACEVIVINDNSTDRRTLEVLEELQAKFEIQIIHVPDTRRGPSVARNMGIERASGKYILPLDADDYILPTYVSKAVYILENNPNVAICYCRAKFFGLKSGEWRLEPYSWERILQNNMIFSTALYRKTDWERVGGYDETLVHGLEDYAFWLHVLDNGKKTVYRLDEVLFCYRIKAHSRTAKANNNSDVVQKEFFASCAEIYKENCCSLYMAHNSLLQEQQKLRCLVSYRVLKFFFGAEWFLRSVIKRVIGR